VSIAVVAGACGLVLAIGLVLAFQTLGGWPTLGVLAAVTVLGWAVMHWRNKKLLRSRHMAAKGVAQNERYAAALHAVDSNESASLAADTGDPSVNVAVVPTTAAPAIVVYCIECGSMSPVPASFAGRTIACRDCGAPLTVSDAKSEERMRRKQAADGTRKVVLKLLALALLFGTSPMAVLALMRGMASEGHAQPPEWWVILGWYYGIWIGVIVVILFGAGRMITRRVDHKNSWGETIGHSDIQTGEVQMFYNANMPILVWSVFYLGAPNVLWVLYRLGVQNW
jgi:hypothetical protein